MESLDPSLFAKTRNTGSNELNEHHKQIAFLEAQVYNYAELLSVSQSMNTTLYLNYIVTLHYT